MAHDPDYVIRLVLAVAAAQRWHVEFVADAP